MNTTEFKNIPIDKIIEPKWDIRKDTKDDDYSDNSNLNGLVQSIKKDGSNQPNHYSHILLTENLSSPIDNESTSLFHRISMFL